MSVEEEVGCPPVASTEPTAAPPSKRAPKITVTKADGTTAGEAPATVPATEPAIEATPAAEPAKRRGRPRGSSNGRTAKAAKSSASSTGEEVYRVQTAIQLTADGPSGRTYFDRVVMGTGASAQAANTNSARQLEEVYKTWEKIYLG